MLEFDDTTVKHSDKIYYGRYPFKVVIGGNTWNHDAYRFAELHTFLRGTDDWWDTQLVQRNKLSVYLKDPKTVEEMEHFFKDMIHEIHCPLNEDVLNEFKLGHYDVRPTLYYNKYRYRIELGLHWNRKGMSNKVESVILSMDRPDTRLYTSKSGYSHILYTNAKHDLVKLKLTTTKDTVIEYKECKLYTEI